MSRVLIGVAWPYVNGDLHIGHLYGYLLSSDIYARYRRLRGDDVLMVSGSDCHGTPITMEVEMTGESPKEIVKKYHKKDIELFGKYNLSFNLYTKTTTKNHKEIVHEFFMDLLRNDYIVKDTMHQYYSVEEKRFLPDRYVEGTCPHCKAEKQKSDQCEKCGKWLESGEILDPIDKLSRTKVILKETEHYFLDFAKFEPFLEIYLKSKKKIWRKWVYAETMGWIKEGLEKRAITRDIDWSMDLPIEEIKKLPKEKQLDDFSGKKIYVWFDAVIGYVSATVEWANTKQDKDDIIFNKYEGQEEDWKKWWKDPETEVFNFMGQDNLVFHTIMWPAMLNGVDKGFNMPDNVVINKFANYEGRKFSKSRNWTIDSKLIAEEFGADVVRYYIASNFGERKTTNFTWDSFLKANNNELVANFGNFVHRTLTFIKTRFDKTVPKGELDNEVRFQIRDAFIETERLLDNVRLSEGLARVFDLIAFSNKYFDKKAVWKVVKEDKKEAGNILYNCIQLISSLCTLISPYLPETTKKLASMIRREKCGWKLGEDHYRFREVEGGTRLGEVKVLFDKIDPDTIARKKEIVEGKA